MKSNILGRTASIFHHVSPTCSTPPPYPDFETVDACEKERAIRIAILRCRNGTQACFDLADKLERCSMNASCKSRACPLCYRQFRLDLIYAMDGLRTNYSQTYWSILHFVSGRDLYDNPMGFSFKRHHDRLRQDFRRVEFNGIAVGGTEAVYIEKLKQFHYHTHMVLIGDYSAAINMLRQKWNNEERLLPEDKKVRSPIWQQDIKNFAKQVSYPFKPDWFRIPDIEVPGPNRPKYRLRYEPARLALLAMDAAGMHGSTFLYGVRWSGKGHFQVLPNVQLPL